MRRAQNGETVKIHYTGTLDDGTVFDSSRERDPFEFTLGEHQVIAGFEEGVLGMAVGEKKDISIPPEEAYGPRRQELVVSIPRANFPKDINPQVGMHLQVPSPDGGAAIVTVTEVSDEQVTVDGNHQLAGQTLHFELELMEINGSALV